MGSNRTPDLAEIIAEKISANRKTMFGGWLPGRIVKLDDSKTKASVQILLLETVEKESGETKLEPVAIINEVPVVTFTDHSGIRIELDLREGDYVTVMFASRSTDRWRQRGGMIDPGDERDHDLNDAIALPALFDFAHVKKPTAKIKFTASEIQAGGNQSLALKSDLEALSTSIDARIAVLTAGLPGTATELATIQAVKDALPPLWPTGTTVLKGG